MITIERGRGWTGSQGRGTARAKARTAIPGRRPPAARLPAPAGRAATRGWPGSPAAAPRTRPRPPRRAALALLIDELTGPDRRCPGADADERAGLLRACAAAESWAAGAKLGVIREMMRCEGPPSPGGGRGGLPGTWSASLRYELAAALACSTQSADSTASLAWELGARLPGIGARLEDGTLTQPKARAVTETFGPLADADAATAEAMIIDQLAGKTYTQVLRLAEQAALTVDPALAQRRREHAQQNSARVSFFREQAGTAAISGRDLPPDEALAAMAAVNARADHYKESGALGDTPMDVLRAYAYLDLLNGLPAAGRIAAAEAQDDAADAAESLARAQARAAARADAEARAAAQARAAAGQDRRERARGRRNPARPRPRPAEADPEPAPKPAPMAATASRPTRTPARAPSATAAAWSATTTWTSTTATTATTTNPTTASRTAAVTPTAAVLIPAGLARPGGPGPRPGAPPTGQAHQRRPADLIVPLATLLGLAERPGEIHGFGLLDPALARELAAAAAASPRTEVCVTVTSPEGYAIGHGCARPARTTRPAPTPPQPGTGRAPPRAARPPQPDHPRRRPPRPPRPPRPGEPRRPRKPP